VEQNLHRIIIGFCLAVASGCLYVMYRISFDDSGSVVVTQNVASALSVSNEVKRKPVGSFSWYGVSTGSLLAYRDAVYVGDNASTVIALNDGSKLTIGPNSLVVLDTKTRQVGNQSSKVTEIRLVRGDVAVQKSQGNSNLKIAVGKNSDFDVKSGSVLALGKRNNNVNLVIKSGGVKVARTFGGKSKEVEVNATAPTRIKDLNLDADLEDTMKKLEAKEEVKNETVDDVIEDLMKFVPKSDKARLESNGSIERFAKDVNLKDGKAIAAIPPTGLPDQVLDLQAAEAAKAEEERAKEAALAEQKAKEEAEKAKEEEARQKLEAEVKAKRARKRIKPGIVNLDKGKIRVKLPSNIKMGELLQLDMSFQKDFSDTFLSLPVDTNEHPKYFDIDISYLIEVPGFRRRVLKSTNLFMRVMSPAGTKYPVNWVKLKTEETLDFEMEPNFNYVVDSGEVRIPLSWNFRGTFIDKFNIILSDNNGFKNVICVVSVPNQNFVDPRAKEAANPRLRSFKYEMKSSEKCPLKDLAKKKSEIFVKVEPVDFEGNPLKSSRATVTPSF